MDEKQATSIALLKINLSNLGKGCTGAMDATKASWGCPPALPTHLDKVSQEAIFIQISMKQSPLHRQKGRSLLLPGLSSIAPYAALLQIRSVYFRGAMNVACFFCRFLVGMRLLLFLLRKK